MNHATYESELADIWRRAVDPTGIGMPNAIAAEIALYTGESAEQVLERMARGKDDFARLWRQSIVDTADSSKVAEFYRGHFIEAYELAEWHSGRLNGLPPLNYPHAAMLARQRGLRRALDFGSGIGTGALCLAQAGCHVVCADISNTLLAFTRFRLQHRGHAFDFLDLGAGQSPKPSSFDLITCFDVLEHVPDQAAKLKELESYLRPGGCLVVNFMNDSFHPDRPMHISSAGNWLKLVRQTALVPDWSSFRYADDQAQVLVRRRYGWARNRIAGYVDRLQAIDAGATS